MKHTRHVVASKNGMLAQSRALSSFLQSFFHQLEDRAPGAHHALLSDLMGDAGKPTISKMPDDTLARLLKAITGNQLVLPQIIAQSD
jgi:hypothetical protein